MTERSAGWRGWGRGVALGALVWGAAASPPAEALSCALPEASLELELVELEVFPDAAEMPDLGRALEAAPCVDLVVRDEGGASWASLEEVPCGA
ncbi:MAG: hypothetical protein H6732_18295 [Alphaproteobacteria bacterium]|nr:hypothetical protein [Alphaproteobacteria bacterium]